MIPEVVVAMLACARIGAPHNVVFGGFSAEAVRERMEFSRGEGADHRRRRRAQGQDRGRQGARRRGHGRSRRRSRRSSWCAARARRARCAPGATSGTTRSAPPPTRSAPPSRWTPSTRCTSSTPPARPPSRRASCTPPAATSPASAPRTATSSTCKPETTCTGARPTSAGSPGHSYIVYGPLANGATSVMWEGAPDYPDKGIWWEIVERYGVRILYCAPDRDPRLHQVGRRSSPRARPQFAAAAGLGRRADQPEGVALVPQGDRRRTLPDRRHLVADRDRRDHDHAAARASPPPSPAPRRSRSRVSSAEVLDESTGEPVEQGQGLLVLTQPWPSMLRTLYKDHERFVETYFERFGSATYLVGDAARRDSDGYFWVIGRIDDVVNVSGPPPLDRRGRVGDRRAPGCRGGGRDRPARRGHRAGDRRVRHAAGRSRRATSARSRASARPSPSASASSRGPSASSGPTICPRRARARSCAGCCATSPRAARSGDVTTLRDPAVTAQLEERVREMQAQED